MLTHQFLISSIKEKNRWDDAAHNDERGHLFIVSSIAAVPRVIGSDLKWNAHLQFVQNSSNETPKSVPLPIVVLFNRYIYTQYMMRLAFFLVFLGGFRWWGSMWIRAETWEDKKRSHGHTYMYKTTLYSNGTISPATLGMRCGSTVSKLLPGWMNGDFCIGWRV